MISAQGCDSYANTRRITVTGGIAYQETREVGVASGDKRIITATAKTRSR